MTSKSIRSKGPFRLALVTGASSGIGKALCRLLAKEGIHLVITGRNKMNLYHIADELRSYVNIVVYPADLSNREERKKIIQKIHELSPDLVINNAGFGVYGKATDLGSEPQLDMVEVNVQALMELTTESAKAMLDAKHPGVIMNISSVAGHFPFPGFAAYAASKAFVNSYSIALDEELKEHGIYVLASCPGRVQTNFTFRASRGRRKKQDPNKMDVNFAANQIWSQILKKKAIHTFTGKYRVAEFLIKYILPRRLVLKILKRRILKD
ncbi:MAG: putative oxidoreductase [Chlamydiae bacterium]|nr:putative oxidoreductase [Chlamydiota bacterium]